jgi:hypothetical protein
MEKTNKELIQLGTDIVPEGTIRVRQCRLVKILTIQRHGLKQIVNLGNQKRNDG